MPLLHNGQLINNDKWTVLGDDNDLPDKLEHTIVSLQQFIELPSGTDTMPTGVLVAPEDDILLLAPYTKQLQLIAISFPVYTDGRGYSHARLLRKRLGYTGELRAMGDIRADQILFMARSGIDSFDFPEHPDTQLVNTLTTRFQQNYQPSYALPNIS